MLPGSSPTLGPPGSREFLATWAVQRRALKELANDDSDYDPRTPPTTSARLDSSWSCVVAAHTLALRFLGVGKPALAEKLGAAS
jgi:hypothetical protein